VTGSNLIFSEAKISCSLAWLIQINFEEEQQSAVLPRDWFKFNFSEAKISCSVAWQIHIMFAGTTVSCSAT
jgi:hypothetical protein